jgi:hypothetical protein
VSATELAAALRAINDMGEELIFTRVRLRPDGHTTIEVGRDVVDTALRIYNAVLPLTDDLVRMHDEEAIDLGQWPAARDLLTALGKAQP